MLLFAGLSLYGYGNLVIIDHGNRWQTAYAHLRKINVVCGGAIYRGQVLGVAGSTGNSTGPYLHFELRSRPVWAGESVALSGQMTAYGCRAIQDTHTRMSLAHSTPRPAPR